MLVFQRFLTPTLLDVIPSCANLHATASPVRGYLWHRGYVSEVLELHTCAGPKYLSVYGKNLVKCQDSQGMDTFPAEESRSQCRLTLPSLLIMFLSPPVANKGGLVPGKELKL